ncbi:hypothetical protein LIA77_11975 [Sarocladium implicatum]|nr:hypothetical protein LIA77_11975 [Sarocladium implicatum]
MGIARDSTYRFRSCYTASKPSITHLEKDCRLVEVRIATTPRALSCFAHAYISMSSKQEGRNKSTSSLILSRLLESMLEKRPRSDKDEVL